MEEKHTCSKTKIQSLRFNLKILENGDLEIVETWNLNIDNINTLFKVFPLTISKYNSISNVKVVEILPSGEEKIFFKTGKLMLQVAIGCYYGLINENGEFEIAWGIDTKNEIKTYKISYKVSNVLKNYNSEYRQLYWQFIGNNFSLPIDIIEGKIEIENNESIDIENLSIHFTPEINTSIEDKVVVFTTNSFINNSYLELKLLLPRKDKDKTQNINDNEITSNIAINAVTNNTAASTISANNNQKQKKKSPIKYIVISLIILFLTIIITCSFLGAFGQNDDILKVVNTLQNETDLNHEQIGKVTDILKDCGFKNYTIKRDTEMDGYWKKGTIAFEIIDEHTKNNISLCGFTIKSNKVYNVYYNKNELYKKDKVKHKISYYFLTKDEEHKYIEHSKEVVKDKLNYPNTAKFPVLYEDYIVTYSDRSKIIVNGKVTAANAFNVTQTYIFEVTYKDDTAINVNLY